MGDVVELCEPKVADQKGRATQTLTMRWVFQFFAGIHRLLIEGQAPMILNLKPEQETVIEVLGLSYQTIYVGGAGNGG